MKKIILLALLALAACNPTPAERLEVSSNPNFQVERLFEVDGCRVYRFRDLSYFRYFARCANGTTSTTWIENCGKNCTRPVEVEVQLVPSKTR
jgi:hypothetical protein